ncbi:hypothetical protein EVC30_063 [Rhizobium phage RHph_Y1_11]|nr:hypothetical protein EVC30_063 [Rhizobium phage RHph_Y1_11]
MATEVSLSTNEAHIIVAALMAVSPSGGGSAIRSLGQKIADALGVDLISDEHVSRVISMANTVVQEWLEEQDVHPRSVQVMGDYMTFSKSTMAALKQVAKAYGEF